jgi:hypothetical protein
MQLMRAMGSAPSATDLARGSRHSLEMADPYYISPAIGDVLQKSAASLPRGSQLSDSLVPGNAGFVWFANSVPVGHPDKKFRGLRAFSWERTERVDTGTDFTGLMNEVSVNFYSETQWGSTRPSSLVDWPFDDSWDGWTEKPGQFTRFDDGENEWSPRMAFERALLLTFFLFLESRILNTSEAALDRAARKRTEAKIDGQLPCVRVVQLRRPESSPKRSDSGHEPVEWSCQWLVSGHWHRYHTRDGVQPRWLMPYVKGPEDKPLRPPRATIYAVVR